MRVLFHLLDAGVGGGQHVAATVAQELVGRDHEIGVVAPAEGPTLSRFRELGATVHSLDAGTLRRPLSAIALARVLRGYDLLYSHTSAPGQMLGAVAARLARKPQLVHHHTHPYFSSRPAIRRLQTTLFPLLLRRARFIAVAEHVAEGLTAEGGIPRSRVVVIENGVSLPERAGPRAPDGPFRVGMLARFDPGKGVHTFIEAAALAQGSAPLEFVVRGSSGPFRDYEERMRRAAGAGGVAVAEPSGDGIGFLETLDVVAIPSFYEGSPLVLLEAMSLGKAVVASDIPGIREVIGSDAGLLVPAEDAAGFAAALTTLAADPELRNRLGDAAREVIRTRYSLERMLGRIVAVVEST